jgi:Txe/YoeB family toxin of toxin-antitoxin system
MYEIRYTRHAVKDIKRLKRSHLDDKAKHLIELLRKDPYTSPPPYETLVGDLKGAYSRRINRQHRLVYRVDESHRAVIVLRMWSHYE